ncbi:hypothetical protein G9H71_04120 [Motilibacter sp. E257]|uniref:DUF3352 domain-containing protein n=1 Tax=Motilibacter deserti TaxID=2714956 RepID=A0ABX0GTG4_9ACTN|nr:hypothetical protein [Motilibacter deserti]
MWPDQPHGRPDYLEHTTWAAAGAEGADGSDGGRPAGRGKRAALIGGTVAAVLAASGAAVAYGALSGGGAQPEDVLPGSALAFAKVDLDPPAGQKVAALRLSRKLPGLSEGAESGSLKDTLVRPLLEEAGDGWSYDEDVRPWLGDRAAVALYAGDGGGAGAAPEPLATGGPYTPVPDGEIPPGAAEEASGIPGMPFRFAVALAYTDEDAARAALDRAELDSGDGSFAYTLHDGFAILSDSQQTVDDLIAEGEDSPLSEDDALSGDLDALEGDQVAVAWADLGGLNETFRSMFAGVEGMDGAAVGSFTPFGLGGLGADASGRVAMGLHVDEDYLEVQAKGRELSADASGGAYASTPTGLLDEATSGSIAALALTGLGDYAATLFEAYPEEVREQAAQIGIEDGDDLRALLGTDTAVALGDDPASPVEGLGLTVRTRSEDPARGEQVLRRLLDAAQAGADVEVQREGDGLRLTLGKAGASGQVRDSDAFRRAVPDAEGQGFVLFVDLAKAFSVAEAQGGDAAELEEWKALEGLGISATGGPESSARIRLTVK